MTVGPAPEQGLAAAGPHSDNVPFHHLQGDCMSFHNVAGASLFATLLSLTAPSMAAPVQYTFTAGPIFSAPSDLASLLNGQAISGSFRYDAATPVYGLSGDLGFEPGYTVYATSGSSIQSFYGLSGSIGGHQFSDIVGSTSIRNGYTGGIPNPSTLDIVSLNAEVTPKVGTNTAPSDYARQLNGFTVGDYTLNNVRLFWASGIVGTPFNFLADSTLPGELPTFQGRIAFDFVRTDDPTNTANVPYYSNTVIFSGLTVQATAVPEADTTAMMVVGLGMLGLASRRRQQKPAIAA
ncbi:MAG: PEP-CTERM sorting domain-containing protein [Rubrivivax sp.]|nr:MAG: PEP-CTERM sorting domain-containing protein [Rubrivivax sp.]